MQPIARSVVFALLVALSSNGINAAGLWMNANQLRETLSGQEISGHYANGRKFTEDFRTDGTLTYNEFGKRNMGRWSITGDTFCTIYNTDPTGGCFRVSRLGANCFEFYFIARTETQATMPDDNRKPAWTARAWLADDEPTCEDESII